MTNAGRNRQPGAIPAAVDAGVECALDRIANANIEELRIIWRERQGSNVPATFTKDLTARVLAYAIQEEFYGGLDARLRKVLDEASSGSNQGRHVKVGSIIVREYEGVVHDVMVVPSGFCWQGQIYARLSTLAKRITRTSWNGPRFFGLRDKEIPANTTNGRHLSAQKAQPEKSSIDRERIHIPGVKRRRGREEGAS